MARLGDLVREARDRLRAAPFDPSPREATLLAGYLLDLSEAQVLARTALDVTADVALAFEQLLRRRLTGEPIAYLLGEKEFYGRSFAVDPRVLIPRPETEHLVEAVLELDPPSGARVVDMGTGCGCLAVTLALERPDLRLVATDLTPAALAVASANVRRYGLETRVGLAAVDLLEGLNTALVDLVVSNPPYIDASDIESLSPEILDWEPHVALFPPGHGDSILDRLIGPDSSLRHGGRLVVEIGHDQIDTVTRRAADSGFTVVAVREDYAGIRRVVVLARD